MTQRLIESESGELKTVKGTYRRSIPEQIAAAHGRPSMTRTDCVRRLAQLNRGHVLAASPTSNGSDSA